MAMPDLFEYFEYRLWLRDAYEARKSRNPAFSHRYIAQKAGFGSSGTFARILDGSRNLSMDGATVDRRGRETRSGLQSQRSCT